MVYAFSPFGYEGSLVQVEVDLRKGIPAVDIVGLADGAVKESRERIRSAIRNSGFEFPSERVLVSLSPADLRKEGPGFDLATALSILLAQDNSEHDKNILVLGELGLDGSVKPARAVHAAVSTAVTNGIHDIVCPIENVKEALEIDGARVLGVDTLKEAFRNMHMETLYKASNKAERMDEIEFPELDGELGEYLGNKGLEEAAFSATVAAAGKHNALFYGESGCGKIMLLQKVKYITPSLTADESQSVTRIQSIAGLMRPDEGYVKYPPFRMPHQTATIEGICGGGPSCRPGEISLAHNGVLFLDEAGEFRTSVLQMLRVPLESGYITLSRAGRSTVFPADFQLLMATNPCPCGNYGSRNKICLCSKRTIDFYWHKFSTPLLDRIEIKVHCQKDGNESMTIESARKMVSTAIKAQRMRGFYNSHIKPDAMDEVVFKKMTKEAKDKFDTLAKRLSARKTVSLAKVSRTIADMFGNDGIDVSDVKKAWSLVSPEPWSLDN